jgi:hypothetical protein
VSHLENSNTSLWHKRLINIPWTGGMAQVASKQKALSSNSSRAKKMRWCPQTGSSIMYWTQILCGGNDNALFNTLKNVRCEDRFLWQTGFPIFWDYFYNVSVTTALQASLAKVAIQYQMKGEAFTKRIIYI